SCFGVCLVHFPTIGGYFSHEVISGRMVMPYPGQLKPGMLGCDHGLKLNLDVFRCLAEMSGGESRDMCKRGFARLFLNHCFRPITHASDILVLFFSENDIIRHTIPLDATLNGSKSFRDYTEFKRVFGVKSCSITLMRPRLEIL